MQWSRSSEVQYLTKYNLPHSTIGKILVLILNANTMANNTAMKQQIVIHVSLLFTLFPGASCH